jgi:hypothetical protein
MFGGVVEKPPRYTRRRSEHLADRKLYAWARSVSVAYTL